jgi:hypothetical protein
MESQIVSADQTIRNPAKQNTLQWIASRTAAAGRNLAPKAETQTGQMP